MGKEDTDKHQPLAIVSTTRTGTITSFNRAAERLLGFDAEEIIGLRSLVSFHDPAELKRRGATDLSEIRTAAGDEFGIIVAEAVPGHTTDHQWTYIPCKGRPVRVRLWVTALSDETDGIAGYVMVLQPHDEKSRSSELLRHQAELLDLANDAILVRDLEHDTIDYWNDGAVRLYGWTSSEAEGAYIHDFLKTVFPQPLTEIKESFLADGFWTGELLHTTRTGERIAVSSRWTLLRNSEDVPSASLELNTDITKQKQAQEALTAAHQELERRVEERTMALSDANTRLQVLSRRLMEIQELERRAIARDLHDEIGQALTAIKMNLREFEVQREAEGPSDKQLAESLLILDQVLQHIRNLALDLRPSMLDELGLIPALRWYVARQAERAGWILKFLADEAMTRPSPEVEITCFRLTQEALTNVARHAKATVVEVRLERSGAELDLIIRDDGVGFVPDLIRSGIRAGTSVGISGMEERVRLAGGRILIHSTPAAGTEIRATFPLDTSRAETAYE